MTPCYPSFSLVWTPLFPSYYTVFVILTLFVIICYAIVIVVIVLDEQVCLDKIVATRWQREFLHVVVKITTNNPESIEFLLIQQSLAI